MSRIECERFEDACVEEGNERRDAYRARRSAYPKRRNRKKPSGYEASPGGIRQRRNKHWNW